MTRAHPSLNYLKGGDLIFILGLIIGLFLGVMLSLFLDIFLCEYEGFEEVEEDY